MGKKSKPLRVTVKGAGGEKDIDETVRVNTNNAFSGIIEDVRGSGTAPDVGDKAGDSPSLKRTKSLYRYHNKATQMKWPGAK